MIYGVIIFPFVAIVNNGINTLDLNTNLEKNPSILS